MPDTAPDPDAVPRHPTRVERLLSRVRQIVVDAADLPARDQHQLADEFFRTVDILSGYAAQNETEDGEPKLIAP